jgi:DNA-binding transcriptional LysR family regulator
MNNTHFDWALIRSFLAVLDAGSVMGAARQMGAQQPTLSRHIAELEAQLRTPLFERTGRGVVPTAAALALVDPARRMEAAANAVHLNLSARSQAVRGTVRIAASQVAAAYLLPPVLGLLQVAEPGIEIELVASNQLSNLLRREADIAVRMVRPVQQSLIVRKLGEVPIVAAAHERYLARMGVPHTMLDLAHHRLIGYDKDDQIVRGMKALGFSPDLQHFAARTDDQVAYGQLVAAGLGVGFLARYNLPYLPGVQPLLPMLKIPALPCWLAVHREIRANALVRKVYDFLSEAVPAALARTSA